MNGLGPGPGFFPFWLSLTGGALALVLLGQVGRARLDLRPGRLLPEGPAARRVLADSKAQLKPQRREKGPQEPSPSRAVGPTSETVAVPRVCSAGQYLHHYAGVNPAGCLISDHYLC